MSFSGPDVQSALALLEPDQLAADPDPATGEGLHLVDQTKERGLAGATGPEQTDDLALVDGEIDTLEDLVVAEVLDHVDGFDQVRRVDRRNLAHFEAPICSPVAAFSLVDFTVVPKPRPKRFSRYACPTIKMLVAIR